MVEEEEDLVEEEEEVVVEVDTVIEMAVIEEDIKEIIIEVVIQIMNMTNKKEEKTIIINDPYNTNILRKCSKINFYMIYNILLYCKMYKKIQNIKFYKFL